MIIIFNPAAGRRRAQLLWRVLDVMVANGMRLDLAETHRRGHAEQLAREAAGNGASLIVAAGGDGTIAEVANGLMGSKARLGIIPLGTANVLAHELALPFAPRAVAASLAFGRSTTLWPGVARSAGQSRLFVQMLGAGFDAHVVHHLSLPLKRRIGRAAYVAQSLRELARYDFAPLTLRIDGVETQSGSIIISKGRFYGGRYLLAPDARPAERGFSVALFDHANVPATLLYGAALPLDQLWRAPGVRRIRARQIDIVGNTTLPAQADGDPVGCTPLSVSDAPTSIEVVTGE